MTEKEENQTLSSFDLNVAVDYQHASLSECVENALKEYFEQLDGQPATNLYDMLLAEVEVPLLKATLAYTNDNRSRAAAILGLNRGTLRKKLKIYGL